MHNFLWGNWIRNDSQKVETHLVQLDLQSNAQKVRLGLVSSPNRRHFTQPHGSFCPLKQSQLSIEIPPGVMIIQMIILKIIHIEAFGFRMIDSMIGMS